MVPFRAALNSFKNPSNGELMKRDGGGGGGKMSAPSASGLLVDY